MSEFDHLPFVAPLQGAIQRLDVDVRKPVDAGSLVSAVVPVDVSKPTPMMRAAHRAIVASKVVGEAGDSSDLDSRRNTTARAMKAVRSVLLHGQVTL